MEGHLIGLFLLICSLGLSQADEQFNITCSAAASVNNDLLGCDSSSDSLVIIYNGGGERSFSLLKFPLQQIAPPSRAAQKVLLSLFPTGESTPELSGRLEVVVVKNSWDPESITCNSIPTPVQGFAIKPLSGYPWDTMFQLDVTDLVVQAIKSGTSSLSLLIRPEENSGAVDIVFGSTSVEHRTKTLAPILQITLADLPDTKPSFVSQEQTEVVAGTETSVTIRVPHKDMQQNGVGTYFIPENKLAFTVKNNDHVLETVLLGTDVDEQHGFSDFSLRFTPTRTGHIDISADWNAESIIGSPIRLACIPAEVDPALCRSDFGKADYFVTHPLPRVALETCFLVETVDSFDNPVNVQGEVVLEVVAGSEDTPCPWRINSVRTGELEVCFTPTDADMINVGLKLGLNGGLVRGFPLEIDSIPGIPVPEKLGLGDIPRAVAGEQSVLLFETYDVASHPTDLDLAATTVEFLGPGAVTHTLSHAAPSPPYSGKSSLAFTASKAGFYSIKIHSEGVLLGPISITVVPASSTASSAVIQKSSFPAIAGQVNVFRVISYDSLGNPKTSGGMDLEASITYSSGGTAVEAGIEYELVDSEDGTYSISWKADRSGQYSLSVFQKDPNIGGNVIVVDGCPFNVSVAPGAMSVKASGLSKQVNAKIVAGDDPQLLIQERDAYQNDLVHPDPSVVVTATLTERKSGSISSVPINPLTGSLLQLVIAPRVVGEYILIVKANDTSFAESALVVIPAPPSAYASVLINDFADSIEVNSVVQFIVRLRDSFGNDLSEGGELENLKVEAIHPGVPVIECKTSDLLDGQYSISFTPTVVGMYNIFVYLKGMPIGESPYRLHVLPGPAFGPFSYAAGSALRSAVAGEAEHILVRARDSGKNDVLTGEAKLNGYAQRHPNNASTSESIFNLRWIDNGDGSYSGSYEISEAGDYSLFVRLNDRDILASPFALEVASNVIVDSLINTDTLNSQKPIAGQECAVLLHAFDEYGNHLTHGSDTILLSFTHLASGQTIQGEVHDLHDGKYNITSVLTRSGDYLISGFVGTNHAIRRSTAGMEFTVVPAQPSPDHSSLFGEGTLRATAGEESNVYAVLRDRFFNEQIKGGARIQSQMLQLSPVVKDTSALGVGIADESNGTYILTYLATVATEYTLKIQLKDPVSNDFMDIQGSPLIVSVSANQASGSLSYLSGHQTRVVAGSPAHYVLHTRDEYNNSRSIGGDAVIMRLAGAPNGTLVSQVKDDNTGLYYVKFIPTKAGDFNIIGYINGQSLESDGLSLSVEPGPTSPNHTHAGWSSSDPQIEAGQLHFIPITPSDVYGNPTNGLDVTWSVRLESQQEKTFGNVTNDMQASIMGSRAGNSELHIEVDGVPVIGSPMSVQIIGSYTSADHSLASGDGLSIGHAGHTSVFQVKPLDRFGNPSTSGPINVQVVDPEGGSVSIASAELEDAHEVAFTPTLAGVYTISILVSGNHISGSPFSALCLAGEGSGSNSLLSGAGLFRVTCGEEGRFQLTVRDNYGNLRMDGVDQIDIAGYYLRSTKKMDFEIESLGGGTFEITYLAPPRPTGITHAMIIARVNGVPAMGRNYTVSFVDGTMDEFTCPENCSGHGKCANTTGLCACDSPWTGVACAEKILNCPSACSGHGLCDFRTGDCHCLGGFSGDECEIDPSGTPLWEPKPMEVTGLSIKKPSVVPPKCPMDCSGHGVCLRSSELPNTVNDTCDCDVGYVGIGCETRTFYSLLVMDQGMIVGYEISTGRMTGFQQGISDDRSCSGITAFKAHSTVVRPAQRKYVHIGGTDLLEIDPITMRASLVSFKFDDLARGVLTKPTSTPIGVIDMLRGKEGTYLGMNRLMFSTDNSSTIYQVTQQQTDKKVLLTALQTKNWSHKSGKFFNVGHDLVGRYLANGTISLFTFDRSTSNIFEPPVVSDVLTQISDFPTQTMSLVSLSNDIWFAFDYTTGNYQSYSCAITESGIFSGCNFLNTGNLRKGYKCTGESNEEVSCSSLNRLECIKSKQCGYCLSTQQCLSGSEVGPGSGSSCDSVDGASMWVYTTNEFAYSYVDMGQNRVLQFEQATGKYIVFSLDKEPKSPKCRSLEDMVGEGYLQNTIGHDITFIGNDILDFNAMNGRFRLATCDYRKIITTSHLQCDSWADGTWPLLQGRKLQIVRVGTAAAPTLILDFNPKNGDYRVWSLGSKESLQLGQPLMKDYPEAWGNLAGLIGAQVSMVRGLIISHQSITSTTAFYEVVGGRLVELGTPVVRGVQMVVVDGKRQLLQMRYSGMGGNSLLQYGPLGNWKLLECFPYPVPGDVFGSAGALHCSSKSFGSPSPPMCETKTGETECTGHPACGWCSMTLKCYSGYTAGVCSTTDPVCPYEAWKYVGGREAGGFVGAVMETEPPPDTAHDCSHSQTCGTCVSDTSCGWHIPTKSCVEGGPVGPKDNKQFPVAALTADWSFFFCKGIDSCEHLGSCLECSSRSYCGWCGSSGQCITGTASGPLFEQCAAPYVFESEMCGLGK